MAITVSSNNCGLTSRDSDSSTIPFHRHCQKTVLSAKGYNGQGGATWDIIGTLNLSNVVKYNPNWINLFNANTDNITQDLKAILLLIDKMAMGEGDFIYIDYTNNSNKINVKHDWGPANQKIEAVGTNENGQFTISPLIERVNELTGRVDDWEIDEGDFIQVNKENNSNKVTVKHDNTIRTDQSTEAVGTNENGQFIKSPLIERVDDLTNIVITIQNATNYEPTNGIVKCFIAPNEESLQKQYGFTAADWQYEKVVLDDKDGTEVWTKYIEVDGDRIYVGNDSKVYVDGTGRKHPTMTQLEAQTICKEQDKRKKFPLFSLTKASDFLAQFRSTKRLNYEISCAKGEYIYYTSQSVTHVDVSSDSGSQLQVVGEVKDSFNPEKIISDTNQAYLVTFSFPFTLGNERAYQLNTGGNVMFQFVNIGYRKNWLCKEGFENVTTSNKDDPSIKDRQLFIRKNSTQIEEVIGGTVENTPTEHANSDGVCFADSSKTLNYVYPKGPVAELDHAPLGLNGMRPLVTTSGKISFNSVRLFNVSIIVTDVEAKVSFSSTERTINGAKDLELTMDNMSKKRWPTQIDYYITQFAAISPRDVQLYPGLYLRVLANIETTNGKNLGVRPGVRMLGDKRTTYMAFLNLNVQSYMIFSSSNTFPLRIDFNTAEWHGWVKDGDLSEAPQTDSVWTETTYKLIFANFQASSSFRYTTAYSYGAAIGSGASNGFFGIFWFNPKQQDKSINDITEVCIASSGNTKEILKVGWNETIGTYIDYVSTLQAAFHLKKTVSNSGNVLSVDELFSTETGEDKLGKRLVNWEDMNTDEAQTTYGYTPNFW